MSSNRENQNNMERIESLRRMHNLLESYSRMVNNYNNVSLQNINSLREVINNYNINIDHLHLEIENIIGVIMHSEQNISTPSTRNVNPVRPTYRQSEINAADSLLNLLLGGTNLQRTNNPTTFLQRNSNPRILTPQQIQNCTENIFYTSDMNELRCPISWEEFTEGDNITRIRRCGHIFRPSALSVWLRTSNTCPSCRTPLLAPTSNVTPQTQPSVPRTNIVNNISSDSDTEIDEPQMTLDIEIDTSRINTITPDMHQIFNNIFRDIPNVTIGNIDLSGNRI